MTDELTPQQEAAVRRLLEEARHDGPVPDDVATRLDDALGRLQGEAAADDLEVFESGSAHPVTELSGVRRRRRNAGRLLLAAAAVVIGGVAVGQGIGGVGSDTVDDDAVSGGGSLAEAPREGGDGAEEHNGDGAAAPAAPEAAAGDSATSEVDLLAQVRAPLPLTSDNFAADVQRELGRTAAERRQAANADYDGVLAFVTANRDFDCAEGAYGQGATLPAYYDAEEAVLVLRRPRAGIQRVELLTCGTAVQLNSVELPAP